MLQPEQGLHACWRARDVRPAAAEALRRSVSSSIDVPRRYVPRAGGVSPVGTGNAQFSASRER